VAKFVPGPLVSEIRNALGAQVFSRNQWGAYTRARVNPLQTPTDDRVVAKDAMTAAAVAWGTTLTDAQRVAWNAFADAMQVRARSPITTDVNGYALFHKLWLLALWWSGNTLEDPPPDLNTPALSSASLSSDGALAQLFLTFAPTPVPAGEILMVYATPPLNPGVSRPYRWFKPIAVFTAGTASPQNIWTAYENAHGSPVPDKKIFSRCSGAFTYNNFPTVPLQSVTLVIGSPDTMLTVSRTLTSAQLVDMWNNLALYELLPAPGAGKIIVPVRAFYRLNYVTTTYTLTGPGTDRLALNGLPGSPLPGPVDTNLLNAGVSAIGTQSWPDTWQDQNSASFENQPISIQNYDGGDLLSIGDGTFTATLYYALLTT